MKKLLFIACIILFGCNKRLYTINMYSHKELYNCETKEYDLVQEVTHYKVAKVKHNAYLYLSKTDTTAFEIKKRH